MSALSRWTPPPMLAMFAIFLAAPLVLPALGYTYLGTEIMIWSIFALGYNLLLSYTGLAAFGHGAFFGMASYYFGMTQVWWTGGVWTPLLVGTLGTAVCGAAVAAFVAAKRGIYFVLLTIAFGALFYFAVYLLSDWTGGEDGFTNIDRAPVTIAGLGTIEIKGSVRFYYFVYFFFVLATVVAWRTVNSPFGQVIQAIKQSESRSRAIGYNTTLYRGVVFVLSCGFAGLAGGLYAMARHGAFAEPMSITQTGNVVLMCLIGGGLSSFYGPVVGVIVFLLLRDVLSMLTQHWMLFYGVLFMSIVLFLPEGILGLFRPNRSPDNFHATEQVSSKSDVATVSVDHGRPPT
jgi:branched-chain amino acid transport system permease protein